MLVTVIIVFVLCQLPLLILNIWYAIDPLRQHGLVFHTLNCIGVLLIVFNTATNFLLYCFFGQKFRQTLVQFILNIVTDQHKQSILQARISKLAENKPPIQSLLSQPKLSANSSSTTNDLTRSKTKSTNLDRSISVDQKPIINTLENQEESCPLISNSEQILIINENFQFKQDQNVNLYTCANGKRILVLKI